MIWVRYYLCPVDQTTINTAKGERAYRVARVESVLEATKLDRTITNPRDGKSMGRWAYTVAGIRRQQCLALVRGDEGVHSALDADPSVYPLPDIMTKNEADIGQVFDRLAAVKKGDLKVEDRAKLTTLRQVVGDLSLDSDKDSMLQELEQLATKLDGNLRQMRVRL